VTAGEDREHLRAPLRRSSSAACSPNIRSIFIAARRGRTLTHPRLEVLFAVAFRAESITGAATA